MIKTRLKRIEKIIERKTPDIDYSDMRIVKFIFDEFLKENDIEGLLLYFAKVFLNSDKIIDKTAIEYLSKNKSKIFNRISELTSYEIAYFKTDNENIFMDGKIILTKDETERTINELSERSERLGKVI